MLPQVDMGLLQIRLNQGRGQGNFGSAHNFRQIPRGRPWRTLCLTDEPDKPPQRVALVAASGVSRARIISRRSNL
jgi:hypothetical protein